MTKTQQLDQLFEKWETEMPDYQGLFVRDGIINEPIWEQTHPKILFVGKEPNHFGNPAKGDFVKSGKGG